MSVENTKQVIMRNHYEYEPEFCIDTGIFKDVCPYIKRKRGDCRIFECGCSSNSRFWTRGSWTQHIKTKTHQKYLEKLLDDKKRDDEIKKSNRILFQKLEQENTRLKFEKNQFEMAKNIADAEKQHEILEHKKTKIKLEEAVKKIESFKAVLTTFVNKIDKYL